MKNLTWYTCIAIAAFMLASPAPAQAKPHQITWTWPTTNCDATALAESDFLSSEMIYSTSPMPMVQDTVGQCDPTAFDEPAPVGAIVVPIDVTSNVVQLNLKPGQTYYVRMNVTAYTVGNTSSWSAEYQFTVPYGRPTRILIADGWQRWEFVVIGVTRLHKKT